MSQDMTDPLVSEHSGYSGGGVIPFARQRISRGSGLGADRDWLVEHRYQAVQEVLAGQPVTEVAARHGMSRQTLYVWRRRYERWEREQAMELWQLDIVDGMTPWQRPRPQDSHRHRRALALHGDRRGRGPADRTWGVCGVHHGDAQLRDAAGSAKRQRKAV